MNKIILMAVILSTLFLTTLGFMFFNSNWYEKEEWIIDKEKVESKNDLLDQARLERVENVDMSNWQVYQNEEYGFEVKYPNQWRWDDIDGISFFPINCEKNQYQRCYSEINFNLYPHNAMLEDENIREWRSQCDDPKNIELVGIDQGVWMCSYDMPYDGMEYHFFDKNKNIFEINIRYNNDQDFVIMERILNSFSFH